MVEIGSLTFDPKRVATYLKHIVNGFFEEGAKPFDLPDGEYTVHVTDLMAAIKILDDQESVTMHIVDDQEEKGE